MKIRITGTIASGKTVVATKIAQMLQDMGQDVTLYNKSSGGKSQRPIPKYSYGNLSEVTKIEIIDVNGK